MSSKEFYEGRIRFALEHHSFSQREQMFSMILSAAMEDRTISVSDMLGIYAQAEAAHQKSMEVNYRETWGM